MRGTRSLVSILAVPFALASACVGGDVRAAVPEAGVRTETAALLARPDPLVLARERLDGAALRALYARHGGTPLWTGGRAADAASAVRDATLDGLEPSDYHAAAIARRLGAAAPRQQAELDLLVSDALLHLTADVHAGRRPPRERTQDIALAVRPVDPIGLVLGAAAAADVPAYVAALAPAHPEYQALRAALARYRTLAADGWPALPDGPPLEPGADEPAVPILRQRLIVTGDLPADTAGTTVYDEPLVAGVRAFQHRHGITPDGVVGRTTRTALNVRAAQRVAQLALNMERWRWLADDLGPRHVRVNIAAFSLRLMEAGRLVEEMPVVVGRDEWETPVFSSRITHVIFNPRWTVPAAIAREDLLPKLQKDPEYLEKHGIRVYAGWGMDAEPVDPTSIDWHADEARVTHLKFAQDPGPENPLGRIKFQVPNEFDVYLHDSPSQTLFQRPVRTSSHGCVRVGDPNGLASWLMRDMPDWSEARRQEVLAGWETRTVRLRSPVPVHVLYLTAWVGDDGAVNFRRDIYGRDEELRMQLRRPEAHPAPGPLEHETRRAAS